jgi:hypothetical protein
MSNIIITVETRQKRSIVKQMLFFLRKKRFENFCSNSSIFLFTET